MIWLRFQRDSEAQEDLKCQLIVLWAINSYLLALELLSILGIKLLLCSVSLGYWKMQSMPTQHR